MDTAELSRILLFTGAILYSLNYLIGWLLRGRKITMTKQAHQFLFALLIINLVTNLFFLSLLSVAFFLCAASLVMMLVLPLGRKGSLYHIVVSTAGLIIYIALLKSAFV
ncbi:MAG: hypothetical protein IAE90_03065 [Ignavibacteria bacterium]|nr:hypothetical protein [Ignavibacteria bacterium]